MRHTQTHEGGHNRLESVHTEQFGWPRFGILGEVTLFAHLVAMPDARGIVSVEASRQEQCIDKGGHAFASAPRILLVVPSVAIGVGAFVIDSRHDCASNIRDAQKN